MKIRKGYVSNSSSSSFIISLCRITHLQRILIEEHSTFGTKLGLNYADTDSWYVKIEDGNIECSTVMDNFDMNEYLDIIGVDRYYIKRLY